MVEEATYKEFNITLNGTTPQETLFLIIPSVLYIFLSNLITSLLCTRLTHNKPCRFVAEFFFIIIPIIVNFCIPSMPIAATHLVLTISLVVFIHQLKIMMPQKVQLVKLKPFITNIRAATNIMTIIAILAVDFEIFPRRFAKTETYGFSLMDLGVGLYIFLNGIVAPEARGLPDSVSRTLKDSGLLFFLGIVRWVLTSRANYNVAVSEYGVHWNFFITLAVTKLFTSFILNVINIKYIIVNAVLLMFCHEILLETGLKEFVFKETARDNFIVANKEGLVSVLGYISLNLFTVYFSYTVNKYLTDKTKTTFIFVLTSLFSLAAMFAFNTKFPISRRLVNSTYCLWILFVGTFIMFLIYSGELLTEKLCSTKLRYIVYSPLIFEAVNYNALAFFLIGNILTGLVNVSIDTKKVKNNMALVIIMGYVLTICLFVCTLYQKHIRLRI